MQPQINPELVRAFALSAEGRHDEAFLLVGAEAARGDAEAVFTLADMYWRGQFVVQDYARGRDLFGQASDLGHPIARRAYTNLLASGVAGGRDWPRAIERLREEARGDTRRAQMLRLIEAMPLTPAGFVTQPPIGERVSERPEIMLFRGLFTREECDFLIAVAEPTYSQSKVVAEVGRDAVDPMRTSEDAPIHWLIEDPATHALNRRLAAASGTRYEQGEPLLILRYRPGQQYYRHYDALPGVDNQRTKTALVYLNDDYAGGETEFSKVGLKVHGLKGDGIVFRNTVEGSRADPMSEHAGLPVVSGTKYLASRWIRERRHGPKIA
jgi:prolyl 4-hydroxylase